MNILVIDIGVDLTKCCLFRVQEKDKLLERYDLLYCKVFETTDKPIRLTLEIKRVKDSLNGLINEIIILPSRASTDTVCEVVENDLTKEKVVSNIYKTISKGKKVSTYDSICLQKYSGSKNHINAIINKLFPNEYDKLKKLLKDLHLRNVHIYSPLCIHNSVLKNYDGLVYDIGSDTLAIGRYKEGCLIDLGKKDSELSALNGLLKECEINGAPITDENVYKIKHSESLNLVKTNSSEIALKINKINNYLCEYMSKNDVSANSKVYLTGGYSMLPFEDDFFEYGRISNLPVSKRFGNIDYIDENILPLIGNCVNAIDYHYSSDAYDMLAGCDSVAIWSNKLSKIATKSNAIVFTAFLLFAINGVFGFTTKYILDTKYQEFAQDNGSELTSAMDAFSKTAKELDSEIMKAKMPKNNFKVSDNLNFVNSIKPDNVNIKNVQYSDDGEVFDLVTRDLEQSVIFSNKLKDIFNVVKVQPPVMLEEGDKPIYGVTIVCKHLRGGRQ